MPRSLASALPVSQVEQALTRAGEDGPLRERPAGAQSGDEAKAFPRSGPVRRSSTPGPDSRRARTRPLRRRAEEAFPLPGRRRYGVETPPLLNSEMTPPAIPTDLLG